MYNQIINYSIKRFKDFKRLFIDASNFIVP